MTQETIDLFQFSYKTLKDKFIENFNVNQLTIELLDTLEETDYDKAINFIVDTFENDFTNEELEEIFKGFKE